MKDGRLKAWVLVFCLCILIAVQTIFYAQAKNEFDLKAADTAKYSRYSILIDIEDKALYLLQDRMYIKKYPIAAGKPETPSPLGSWRIVHKSDWGKGFGGRWLELDVPWGKYGIHGTTRPGSIGRDASHGCIRMLNKHVKELYDIIPIGTQVVIVNGSFGIFGRGFRILKPGDRGADVMVVQKRLKELGYYAGTPDVIYGEGMKKAIHRFQREKGLEVKNEVTRQDYSAMGLREFE